MSEQRTPGAAAYQAWMKGRGVEGIVRRFDGLGQHDQQVWNAVADAVICQAKSIIAEEMVKAASAGEPYFCVVDATGVLVHTTLSLSRDEAINQWLAQEQAVNFFVNAGRSSRGESPVCSASWEQFEAQGFKVLPVKLEAVNANNS